MGRWRTDTERWLEAEQDGADAASEAALARLFEALPPLEPSPAFAARATDAAWAARARTRHLVTLAAAATAVAAVAGATALSAGIGAWAGWLLATATSLASASLVSGLGAALTAARWWAATAAAGSTLAAAPYALTLLALVEFAAVAALYGLHRLLRAEAAVRRPGTFLFLAA